ncbi:hypothetical protein GCM10009780_43740 [Actinomadura alba]
MTSSRLGSRQGFQPSSARLADPALAEHHFGREDEPSADRGGDLGAVVAADDVQPEIEGGRAGRSGTSTSGRLGTIKVSAESAAP